jgi:hypothetical protein
VETTDVGMIAKKKEAVGNGINQTIGDLHVAAYL